MTLTDLGFKGKRLEKLNSNGIRSVHELLYKMPRKYMALDKVTPLVMSHEVKVAAQNKTPVVFYGQLTSVILDKAPGSKMSIIKMQLLGENTNLYINIFGQRHKFEVYREYLDKDVYIGGLIQIKSFRDKELICMADPFLVTQNKADLKIYPIYRNYKGISKESYEEAIKKSFENITDDYLPESIKGRYNLLTYTDAIKTIHFPENEKQIVDGEKRIVFDNMLYFASCIASHSMKNKETSIYPIRSDKTMKLIETLPFKLTEDQLNAIINLKNKMCKMQTTALIQGDVSCGKTIVAFCLMLILAENGYQSVLIAPTVLLAKQHYGELLKYASDMGYSVSLLDSSLPSSEKKNVLSSIKNGKSTLIVGTHSCFSEDVIYNNLGLVITDEEHKFGVTQREQICKKSNTNLHMISMSATPIPRSIACSIYGNDVEVINIRQMPNGRKKVQTAICSNDQPIINFMKEQIAKGHQAYVVCPLIEEVDEESRMYGVSSIEEVSKKYSAAIGNEKIGVITGKTDTDEAQRIKQSFYENKIKVLIATTVIEVGINVPNATLIVIESAERFGIATLHQLRGRVGRGSNQSYCILKKTDINAKSRNLEIIKSTTDGFEIAKADFKNRGPGNILGTQQSGKNSFVHMICCYPMLYNRVTEIAKSLTQSERDKYIENFERNYPSCL